MTHLTIDLALRSVWIAHKAKAIEILLAATTATTSSFPAGTISTSLIVVHHIVCCDLKCVVLVLLAHFKAQHVCIQIGEEDQFCFCSDVRHQRVIILTKTGKHV